MLRPLATAALALTLVAALAPAALGEDDPGAGLLAALLPSGTGDDAIPAPLALFAGALLGVALLGPRRG